MSASRNLLNYFLTNLRGHLVLVQLKDCTVYEGVFHTADMQSSPNHSSSSDSVTLVIKQVQQQADSFAAQYVTSPRLQHTVASAERNTAPFIAQRKFALSDIVQMRAVALDFNDTTEGKKAAAAAKKGIATDKEISNRDFQERELTRWEASSDGLPSGSGGLEDESAVNGALSATGGRGWDQFTVHERMTGRQSTFDMNDYTTPLDKQSVHYRENLARAERIAREIERQGSGGNLHVAMERGQEQEKEGEVDEERLFSSVLDEAKGSKIEKAARLSVDGKYVPPGRRREVGDTGTGVDVRKSKGVEAKEEEKEKEKVAVESERKAETRPERVSEQKVTDGTTELKATAGKSGVAEKEEKTTEDDKRESKPDAKKELAPLVHKRISVPSTDTPNTPAAPTAADAVSQSSPSPTTASATTSTDSAASTSSSSTSSPAAPASANSSSASAASTTSAPSTADKSKPKSTLNPKAKSFSLSASAKEFVPSTAPSSTPATPTALPLASLPTAPPPQPPQPSLPFYGGQQLPQGMQQQAGGYGNMNMGMALMHPGVGGHMQFAGAMGGPGGPRLMNGGGMLPPGSVPMVAGQQLQPAAYFAQQPYAMPPMQPQQLQLGMFPPQQQFNPFVPHQPGQPLQLGGGAGRGGLNAAQQQQLMLMAAAAQQQQQQQQQQMHDPRFFNPQQPFQPQQGAFNQQRFQ